MRDYKIHSGVEIIDDISVDGEQLLGQGVAFEPSLEETAASVAREIRNNNKWTALADGTTVKFRRRTRLERAWFRIVQWFKRLFRIRR